MSKVVYKVPECFLHAEAYLYYCESCEEPICKKCTIIGPHNNELHLCNHINESYRLKVSEVEQLLHESFPFKRKAVLSQVSRLQLAIEETKAVKESILKYTKEKSLGILNRLEKVQENKSLYLKNLIQTLYKDLNSINDVGHQFQEMTKETNPNRMIDLLGNYRRIQSELQRLCTKIYNEILSVSENDLPQELSEIRWRLQKNQSYQEINKSKCEIISKTLEKRFEEEGRICEKVERQFQDDIKSWRKETEINMGNFLNNFNVCHFCGYTINETIINEECRVNGLVPKEFKGYCEYPPTYEYYGTSRHYFEKRAVTGDLNLKDPVVEMYLKVLIGELRISILNHNIDFQGLVKKHDPNLTGEIKKLDLMYILSEKCGVGEKAALTIISSLPLGTGLKYQTLLHSVNNNN